MPETKAKKKTGPKFSRVLLTDEKFDMLIELLNIQCTKEEICGVLGMSDDTLFRALKQRGFPTFEEAVARFGSEGKRTLRRAQWEKAIEEKSTQMQIWLGKQILQQSDKVDNTSSDGSMSPPKTIVIRGVKANVDNDDRSA